MDKNFKYVVTPKDVEENLALKDYLRKKLNLSSRLITKIKKNESLMLNGQKTPAWIVPKVDDIISVSLPHEKSNFEPENIPINVIYEDDNLLIIDKQPFLVVHPTSNHQNNTIANGIMNYMIKQNESYKIRFVNRLDRDTSGLMIIGKNSNIQNQISNMMKKNHINKQYIALVHGIIEEDKGEINLPIGRDENSGILRKVKDDGYDSLTYYEVIQRFTPSENSEYNPIKRNDMDMATYKDYIKSQEGKSYEERLQESPYKAQPTGFTLVKLTLKTGRTHQIRVHLSHIGHCIVGDSLYGIPSNIIDRQALHSYKLSFKNPIDDTLIDIVADLHKDMKRAIELIDSKL